MHKTTTKHPYRTTLKPCASVLRFVTTTRCIFPTPEKREERIRESCYNGNGPKFDCANGCRRRRCHASAAKETAHR